MKSFFVFVFFAAFAVLLAADTGVEAEGSSQTDHLWSEGDAKSRVRQKYHSECESSVNDQINMELHASYVYKVMAYHFDRDDVALSSFRDFFMKSSHEEQEHAEKLMQYQNKRGGHLVYYPIEVPKRSQFANGLDAMKEALALERKVNAALLDLHATADKHRDPHLQDFLESHYLDEQVESIRQISAYITLLEKVGDQLGEFQFDVHGFDRGQPRSI